MAQKVNFQLNDQFIRELTVNFPGWEGVQEYETEFCQFRTSEGKGKDFYRVRPAEGGAAVIVKVFPQIDGSMGMTEDRQMRELAFVGSDLHREFAKAVEMPQMAVVRTPEGFGLLAMEDVSEELKKVGPGAPLNRELVVDLIQTIGRLHSLHWQRKPAYDWLMDFELWVRRGAELLLAVVEDKERVPAWAEAILKDKPGLRRAMPAFLADLPDEQRVRFIEILRQPEILLKKIAGTPMTVGHNDLFFTNLGLRNGRTLMIDWEFVGYAPAAWDLHSSYAGMPPVGVSEEEMVELYFAQIPNATAAEREAWLNGYKVMGTIEGLILGLRVLIPVVYDPESKVPAEVKAGMREELGHVLEEVLQAGA